jgi:hypothetical protein
MALATDPEALTLRSGRSSAGVSWRRNRATNIKDVRFTEN